MACGQEVYKSGGCAGEHHLLKAVHVAMVPGEGMAVVLKGCLATYQERVTTMTYYLWSPPV